MSLKSLSRGVAGFLFGLSVTVLFVSVWGRAVVVDTDTLAEAAAPLTRSEAVVDAVGTWVSTQVVKAGAPAELVDPAVSTILESSATARALERLVVEVVAAAAVPDPEGAVVDVAAVLEPAVPEVVTVLSDLGVPVSEDQVLEGLDQLDPLVVREAGVAPYVGPASPAAGRLGTATVLAMVALLVTGGFLVVSASDRLTELRRILTRFAVGGLSFMILLRLGSWVLDPQGGRAPVAETVSHVLGSHQMLPAVLAGGAGVAALGIFVTRRLVRRSRVLVPEEPPSRERELVEAGSPRA